MENTKTKHTQATLRVRKGARVELVIKETDKRFLSVPYIGNDMDTVIADFERMAKCWNNHDALLDGLKTINEQITRHGSITITNGSVMHATLENIIKRAEQE